MTLVSIILLTVGLLSTASVEADATRKPVWNRYENARFGYSVEFPSGWVPAPESANSDGRVIRSATRDVLTVWGGFTDFAPSSTDYSNVTLRRTLADGWIESGYTPSGSIFYARLRRSVGQSPNVYAVFELTYPKSRKTVMDATVTRISKTFAAPCTINALSC